MAVTAHIDTKFGERKELYIRVNSIEASNHGKQCVALLRGFLSKEAFENGAHFLWEDEIEFKGDVSKSLWNQAYKAFKKQNDVNSDV